MKLAITSQDRTRITDHAGTCRTFWIYEIQNCRVTSKRLLELSAGQCFRESDPEQAHPLDDVSVLITGGMGAAVRQRLKRKGVFAVATAETDPDRAVVAFFAGTLEPLPSETVNGHTHGHPN